MLIYWTKSLLKKLSLMFIWYGTGLVVPTEALKFSVMRTDARMFYSTSAATMRQYLG
jgi:hypothetical protein